MARSMMNKMLTLAAAAMVALGSAGAWAQSVATKLSSQPAGVVLFSETDVWRKHYTFSPPVFAAPEDGSAAPAGQPKFDSVYTTLFQSPPPPDWSKPDFDASIWLLRRGREFAFQPIGDVVNPDKRPIDSTSTHLRGTDAFFNAVGLICQRGYFRVSNPKAVAELSLSLTCRGGFVAYLNGKEVARANLPDGPVDAATPAEAHPAEVFFTKDSLDKSKPAGADINNSKAPQWALRERTFGPKPIPAELLTAGVNVLAIELHRAAYPAICRKAGIPAAMVGLSLLELAATPVRNDVLGQAELAMVSEHLQPWAADIAGQASDRSHPLSGESAPVRIVAARNGAFAGMVMIPCGGGMLLPHAQALKHADGSAEIPASNVQLRWAAPNPLWPGGLSYLDAPVPGRLMDKQPYVVGNRLDMLTDRPDERALASALWISVKVPKDAKAGLYKGSVFGVAPPIELRVADWTLPDVKDFASLMNIYQSPDTLAEYYQLTPWSAEHWKMVEKSLALLGRAGNIGLHIPLLAQTQVGNPESMVTWIKQADGTYKYDFSRMDQYIRLAQKHHTRLRFICAVAWGYEASLKDWKGPVNYETAVGAQVSVLDPASGKTSLMKLPRYGTQECEDLWRPALHALRDHLKEQQVQARLALGLCGDRKPEPEAVAMFRRILPEAAWICEAHLRAAELPYDLQTKAMQPVLLNSIVYGGEIPDPLAQRKYGWQHKDDELVMMFNRSGAGAVVLHMYPPPWSFRFWMEGTLASGRAGNGRVGGDFWRFGAKIIGEGKIDWGIIGGSGGSLYNRYVHSNVDETGIGRTTSDLFAPSPDGPVATVRFENALEGNQEAEARVFMEKALLDKSHPLPAELAKRCQQLLDERAQANRLWFLKAPGLAPQGWQERSMRLYDLAGEVAKAK